MALAFYSIILLILMFLGVPIAFSLLASTVIYITCFADISMMVACKQIIAGVNSFPLLALPFFLLLGEMLSESGLTQRLINLSNSLVGHMKGSLAQVNVVSSMLLAGVQGAATSDTAAVGGVMIPAMKKDGYSPAYSAVVTACSASVGPIIPPSLTMVVFGSIGSVSIGRLFLGGALPGLLLGLSMMVYVAIKARKGPKYCGTNQPFSLSRLLISFKEGWLVLTIPFIIVVGIAGGIFTPTESGTFAVIAAIILGMLVFKTLTFKSLFKCVKETVYTLGNITIIVAAAAAFGWILSREGAVELFQAFLYRITTSPIVIMLIINVIYLVAGCFIETLALVILFVPIFLPIVTAVGYDPIHFGIITVLNLTIGTITPPLGICMYMACDIGKVKMEDFVKEAIPFLIPIIIIMILIIFVPWISTWLPNLLMPI